MNPIVSLRAYAAHADPATAAANQIALMLGSNGPIYPLYLIAIVGHKILLPSLLTMFAMPFYLAVPAIARRNPRAGRLTMVITGTINTLWCVKLLGVATALNLIFLPCILVAVLLYREQAWFWALAAIPTLALALPPSVFGTPLVPLAAADAAHLAAFHRYTVAVLTLFLVWQLAAMLRSLTTIRPGSGAGSDGKTTQASGSVLDAGPQCRKGGAWRGVAASSESRA